MAIKKYSKVKFTLRKELIFILAAIVVLVVATILLNLPNEEEKFLAKWNEAGSQMTENTLYEEVSFDELRGILDSKGANEYTFVFFATPNEECVQYFDTFVNVAKTFEVEKIYIVDSAFAKEGNREEDAEFDAKLSEIENNFKKADGETTIDLDYVPNLWVFNGKDLEKSASGDYSVDEVINWNLVFTQMFAYGKN